MKVLKFGGTSVGSVQSIQTLLNILKEEVKADEQPVVVLSAMSGVTNLLIEMAEGAARGIDFTESLAELERRHFDVVKACSLCKTKTRRLPVSSCYSTS